MADQEDEIILSELDDEELVQQMFDDLYDGLKEEIEEAVHILLERKWEPYRILTEALAKAGAIATGIDLAEVPLKVAAQHAESQQLTIDYRYEDITTTLENNAGQFDVITCLEMLEHVPDPSKIIEHCMNLLKPGGQLIVSTINRNLKAYLAAIIAAEYILRIVPIGTHSYKKLIRPKELVQWAENCSLKLENWASFIYNPIKKSFKTKYNHWDINYIAHFSKPMSKQEQSPEK